MAPIGTIVSSIDLDKHKFQGSGDPITGTLAITFHPSAVSDAKQEIFGPLKLTVTLRGYMKLVVRENRTSHAFLLFDERRQLVNKTVELLNGPFRASAGQPQKFSFHIHFPSTTDLFHGRLPPSFHTKVKALAPRQYGHHQGTAWIEYNVSAGVEMGGIDVQLPKAVDSKMVQYESMPENNNNGAIRESQQRLEVQTYDLLPEAERPSGLLGTTKAVLNSIPKPVFSFNAICTNIPETIAIGQSIKFEICVRTLSDTTTCTSMPDMTLGGSRVELIATTKMYATNEKGVDSPTLEHSGVVATLVVNEQVPGEPFSKANDFTKTILTSPIPMGLSSSFNIVKLSRSYSMRMRLKLMVAGRTATMKKELDVRLAPHYLVATPLPAEASSRPAQSFSHAEDGLPAYE